jgi:hypothetical protein
MKALIIFAVLLCSTLFAQSPVYLPGATSVTTDSGSSASVAFRVSQNHSFVSFKVPPSTDTLNIYGTDTLSFLVKSDAVDDATYNLLRYNNAPVYVVIDTTATNAISLNSEWFKGWRNIKIQWGLLTPVVQDTLREFPAINELINN